MRIHIFDSTLHDGARSFRVSFGVEDKLLIARRLDDFGVDYINGGWPGVDARDREFFARAREMRLAHAKLAAYGAVRFAANSLDNDPSIKALFESAAPVVCLAGESWDMHVYKALETTAEAHLAAIRDSIGFFKDRAREVVYNAEHFFDAWESNPDFALATVQAARDAGADVVCLCDTNGGMMTTRLADTCSEVGRRLDIELGIHAHNDSDLAVANTLAAVERGFTHVQGSINGYGERCGSANLCSIIPNLELKSGHTAVGREKLEQLNSLAHFVAEHANLGLPPGQPYVGANAFAHPAAAAEHGHTKPEYVGNLPRTGDLMWKLARDPLASRLSPSARRELIDAIRQKEHEGYDLAGADGSFELLVRETLYPNTRFFTVLSYEVSTRRSAGHPLHTAAEVTVEVNDSVLSATAAGQGPVHALDLALRQCLLTVYPAIGNVRLVDYKMRMLDPHKGSAAKARALTEWSDGETTWTTAGVSDNIIEASWLALAAAVQLELLRLHPDDKTPAPVEDYSWAV
jgi:2-isopropylmalate synthase